MNRHGTYPGPTPKGKNNKKQIDDEKQSGLGMRRSSSVNSNATNTSQSPNSATDADCEDLPPLHNFIPISPALRSSQVNNSGRMMSPFPGGESTGVVSSSTDKSAKKSQSFSSLLSTSSSSVNTNRSQTRDINPNQTNLVPPISSLQQHIHSQPHSPSGTFSPLHTPAPTAAPYQQQVTIGGRTMKISDIDKFFSSFVTTSSANQTVANFFENENLCNIANPLSPTLISNSKATTQIQTSVVRDMSTQTDSLSPSPFIISSPTSFVDRSSTLAVNTVDASTSTPINGASSTRDRRMSATSNDRRHRRRSATPHHSNTNLSASHNTSGKSNKLRHRSSSSRHHRQSGNGFPSDFEDCDKSGGNIVSGGIATDIACGGDTDVDIPASPESTSSKHPVFDSSLSFGHESHLLLVVPSLLEGRSTGTSQPNSASSSGRYSSSSNSGKSYSSPHSPPLRTYPPPPLSRASSLTPSRNKSSSRRASTASLSYRSSTAAGTTTTHHVLNGFHFSNNGGVIHGEHHHCDFYAADNEDDDQEYFCLKEGHNLMSSSSEEYDRELEELTSSD